MTEGMRNYCEAAVRPKEPELNGSAGKVANNRTAGGRGVDDSDVAGLGLGRMGGMGRWPRGVVALG